MKLISKREGFTLIEMLVVIAIITVLATYLLVNVLGLTCTARQGASKAAILEMDKALHNFYTDYSCYPDDEAGFSSRPLVSALNDPDKKQYYPFKKGEIKNGEWTSRLGAPYYYRNNFVKNYGPKNPAPGDVYNKDTYDIWSKDCRTPEGAGAEAIAQKTKVCNWE